MDENLTSKASHRITGNLVPVGRVSNPFEIRDRIPGFHTYFTQIDRSETHTLRHIGQHTNA